MICFLLSKKVSGKHTKLLTFSIDLRIDSGSLLEMTCSFFRLLGKAKELK